MHSYHVSVCLVNGAIINSRHAIKHFMSTQGQKRDGIGRTPSSPWHKSPD